MNGGLELTIEKKIEAANERAMDIMLNGRPTWVDVQPALDVIPGMKKNLILVAGPPIEIDKITQPVRTAICGAAVYEGLAGSLDEGWKMVKDGRIEVDAAQNHNCACGAAKIGRAHV